MQDVQTTARLIERESPGEDTISVVLARSEPKAALNATDSAQLWFELELADDNAALLNIDLTTADIKEILRRETGDEIVVALDVPRSVRCNDSEVEAHGLKGAVAIAVATAAILAPAGHAATAQSAGVAATTQGG